MKHIILDKIADYTIEKYERMRAERAREGIERMANGNFVQGLEPIANEMVDRITRNLTKVSSCGVGPDKRPDEGAHPSDPTP